MYEDDCRQMITRRSKNNVKFGVIHKGSDTSKEVEVAASTRTHVLLYILYVYFILMCYSEDGVF